MPRSSTICDSCSDKATHWLIYRRPSDPSELVSVLATCKEHAQYTCITDKEELIKALTPKDGGCVCSLELIEWMEFTDEGMVALAKIGIDFVTL